MDTGFTLLLSLGLAVELLLVVFSIRRPWRGQ